MKLKKSELRKMVRKAVYKEVLNLAREQKHLSECIKLYLGDAPFLSEHKKVTSKKALLEFFGPFKKMGVKDLEKLGKGKDVKQLLNFAKNAEEARKNLSSLKLTNVNAVEVGLQNYIEKLVDLYNSMKEAEVDEKLKGQLAKPFAAAAYTLQSLSASLADAANDLFSSVPRASGMYSAGREAEELEKAQSKFMMGKGERLKKSAKDVWTGMGGPAGGTGVMSKPPRD